MEGEPVVQQLRMFNYDTLLTLKHHLLEGIYYIRIGTATTLIPYSLTPRFTPNAWTDDNEPNNDIITSTVILPNDEITGNLLYYEAGVGNDEKDWYALALEEGGLLDITIQKSVLETTEFWIRLLDAEIESNPVIAQYRMFHSDSMHTISTPLLKGRYFILVNAPSHPNTYKIETTFTPPQWTDDTEPNQGDSTAVIVNPNDTFSGTILSYGAGEGYDDRDWYQMTVDHAGFLELNIKKSFTGTSEFTVFLRDGEKEGFPEIKRYRLFHGDDDVKLTKHLLAGTYYIHIGAPYIANNYQITSTFYPTMWPEDSEPNNDTTSAIMISVEDSITGNLSYYEAGVGHDPADWYVFEIMEEGLLTLDIFKENNDAIFWVYLRDPSQGGNPVINQKRLFFDQFTERMKTALKPGKYFIQVATPSRDLEYLIRPVFLPIPTADFNYTQVNTSVLFENLSLYGSQFTWEFGDEELSNAVNPLHEYGEPGVYDVCLNVTNESGSDQKCKEIIVEGLASVYPNEVGNTGDATVEVYGGGLEEGNRLFIEENGIVVAEASDTFLFQRDAIQGTFDLRGKDIGKFDIVIQNSSGKRYVLKNSISIVEGKRPDPWVEVSGRNRILFNTPTTYTVRYGNNGNVDASMVNLWIAISEYPDLKLDFNEVNFIIPNLETDSIHLDEETNSGSFYFLTDSVLGKAFHSRVYPLILPNVAANSTNEFKIKITSPGNIKIMSWVNEPAFQSPMNANIAACLGAIFTENFHNALPHLNRQELECFHETYSNLFKITVDNGKVDILLKKLLTINKRTLVKNISIIKNALIHCTDVGNDSAEATGWVVMNVLIGQLLTSRDSLEACFKSSCNTQPPAIRERNEEECTECGTYCALNICETNISAVSSLDPNEKDQPAGYTEENYTFLRKTIPYTIYFENLDSATAPAHVVRVVDSLDDSKFDFSTLQFGSVTIGDSTYYAEKGFNELIMDVPLNHLNLVARVEGRFDTLTGVLEWIFLSLDPVTLEPIEDPDVGFLPPNVTKPEGEGHVTFQIGLIPELENMDVIRNKALIYFDANDPIETNVSSFALDLNAPDSSVDDLEMETSDTLILLEWGGRDLESGVRAYDVYYSKDGETMTRWKRRTSLTSDYFDAEPGSIYRFFSVAIDSVGNEEGFPDSWDAETFISTSTYDHEVLTKAIHLFPNPCYGRLHVEIDFNNIEPTEWSISNALGTIIMKQVLPSNLSGGGSFDVNLSNIPGGVYFLKFLVNDRYVTRKFMLIND